MALTLNKRPVRFSLAWLKPPELPPDGAMTLFEHLRELRYRLVIASLAILVATIACAFFYNDLYRLLLHPYELARVAIHKSKPELNLQVVQIGLAAPFSLATKISVIAGLVASAPVWLYQIWAFVVPGLLAKEKKWTITFVVAATPLFLSGVALAYWIMPKGIAVLVSFSQGSAINMLDVNLFLAFLIRVMLVFGVAFLIPVFVLMLNFLGVIKARQLAKARSYVVFGTFVFAAVATPSTDPISMLALAIPMTVLFIAAEVIAHISDRRKARKLKVGEDTIRGSVDDDQALRELNSEPQDPDHNE